MYQVVVSCSCFQLLHGQPTTTCSKKKNIGLLEKQGFFFPSNAVADCTLDEASLLSLLLAVSFCLLYWRCQ